MSRPAINSSGVLARAQRLGQERRFTEAVALLKGHLKTRRDDASAMGLLGALHADMGQGAEAKKILKKAMRLQPRSAELRCRFGRVLAKEGQLDLAADEFERARSLAPGQPWIIKCLSDALVGLRKYDEAARVLDEAMAQSPGSPDLLLAHLGVAPHVDDLDRGVRSAETLLARDDLPGAVRAQVGMAHGAMLARLGEHDRAFDAFESANRAAPGEYDAERNALLTDRMIEAWTEPVLASIPESSRRTRSPVFIVGMPRSGTSLVEQIIASHPSAFGAGELPLIQRIVSVFNDGAADPIQFLTDPGVLTTRENVENASAHYLEAARAMAPGAERITDKMPDNFRALGLIEKICPGARVVHCVRDARDTCLSVYSNFFIGRENGFSTDLRDLGAFYADYWRLMRHWKSVLRIPILDVSYEDLVADAETQSRRLIDFLGIRWDERCLSYYESKRRVKTLSSDQAVKPIYQTSVGRWAPYAQRLAPMIELLPSETFRD